MKIHHNPFINRACLVAASLAAAVSTYAADITLGTGTYTDTQTYNNGTISGPVTFNSGANYTFDSLNLPLAWNRVILNGGAALNVGGIQLQLIYKLDSSFSGVLQSLLVLLVVLGEGARQRFLKKN